MTAPLTVSVVIVSRDRAQALRRCIVGVSQQFYRPFEVVVVADRASCSSLRTLPQAVFVKIVEFGEANVSAARNAGIAVAAGEVIAFIDDDAVPEPTWLDHLAAPFADREVMASGGFVRGRNGISWQSRAGTVDATGQRHALEVPPNRPSVWQPEHGRAIHTEGTNMAIRRSCLAGLGGFDPRFRFFLDETDLDLRIAALGHAVAIAPLAEVHHGYAPSPRRRQDRAPTDLHEIGASWAVFLSIHCPADRRDDAWQLAWQAERQRALSLMVDGRLEPRDVERLMVTLDEGFAEGMTREEHPMPPLPAATQPFLPYPGRHGGHAVLIAGRLWSRHSQRRRARVEAEAGNTVTVMRFTHTGLFHSVSFSDDGFWEHIGGLFGRSDRNQRLFRIWTFPGRVRAETERIRVVRGLNRI